jgi:hypothetical protein
VTASVTVLDLQACIDFEEEFLRGGIDDELDGAKADRC